MHGLQRTKRNDTVVETDTYIQGHIHKAVDSQTHSNRHRHRDANVKMQR